MSTEIISIRVDAEAARAFNALPEEDREDSRRFSASVLCEITHGGESLEEVLQEISEKAKAHVWVANSQFSDFWRFWPCKSPISDKAGKLPITAHIQTYAGEGDRLAGLVHGARGHRFRCP